MPGTMPLVPDQLLRSLVSGARMPLAASVGVSVLPSSVMSGMFLPLDSALFQCVVRLDHGVPSTLTCVLAYCGSSLWNSATTLFIQVTCEATEPPMRQTVSVLGADDELPDVLPAELEPLELQPAIASAAAATPAAALSAADLFLSPTCWHSFCEGDRSRSNSNSLLPRLPPRLCLRDYEEQEGSSVRRPLGQKLIGNFPIR